MSKVRKFLVALGGAAGVFSAAAADGAFSASEVSGIVIALVGACLVWLVPNEQ